MGFGKFEFGDGDLLEVDFKGSDKSCFCKEVWSVVHAVEFVVEFFLFECIFLDGLLDFDAELKAELVELLQSVLLAHEFVEAILFYFEVWHRSKLRIY